ncbi:hypothetical protein CQA4T8M7_32740 [Sphaerotilus natans]|nr:hypothetical protein CQA4T8M7_32740 [Sphaerotilus natans]
MPAQPNPTVPFDCSALVEDGNYRVQLAPGVWLMDNHKWALLAWERERVPGRRYVLVHADFHWDGVDDFASDGAPTKELLAADVDELESMIAGDKYIRFDSFIAPAVRRGLLSEVHFSCHDLISKVAQPQERRPAGMARPLKLRGRAVRGSRADRSGG